jgi:superfamily II DNA or RNA helicase
MQLKLSQDKKFLIIESCTELEYEQMKLSLTKKIDGWRFHPLVKKRLWDGNISFIKGNKIPSGLWKEVIDIGKEYNLKIEMSGVKSMFDEEINEEEFSKWAYEFFEKHPKFQPRDYQIHAAFQILRYRRCLAELATSAGKTLISFMVIAYLFEVLKKKRILFIVPNVSLVIQATEDFDEYNLNDRIPLKVQQIYAGAKIKKSSNVVVGTYQSLVKKEDDYFEEFDVVMVDETHKAKSFSIRTIMDKCWHCDYRFGLSGTIPKRGTVDRLTLMSCTGPLITNVSANFLQQEGHVTACKVSIIEMDYATDKQKESFYFLSKTPEDRKTLFNLEQNFIVSSQKRRDFISKVIGNTKQNSLVLFYRIDQGEALYNDLRAVEGKEVYYVDGGTDKDIRELYKKKMEKGNNVILVASYGTFSTGISINNIHNIFLTESFKSEVIIRQSIGRGLRKHSSKDMLNIIDFVDDFRWTHEGKTWKNYMYKQSESRIEIYVEQKFPYEVKRLRF